MLVIGMFVHKDRDGFNEILNVSLVIDISATNYFI